MAAESRCPEARLVLATSLAIAALVPSLVGCQTDGDPGAPYSTSVVDAEDSATLQLRLALDAEDARGFSRVSIVPEWAGANTGAVRDDNWMRVPVAGEHLEVGARPDSTSIVGMGELPVGNYDRVFVAAAEVQGQMASGEWVSLANHIEPIARRFEVSEGEHATVTIHLVIMPPSSQGDGRFEIFVKDAGPVEHGYATLDDSAKEEGE